MRNVLADAALRMLGGCVIGLGAAWAMSGALSSLAFGVTTTSPVVYAAVIVLLVVLGLIGAFVPALRAARLEPLAALRAE